MSTGSSTFPVRNPVGWRQRLQRLQGVPIRFDLRPFDAALAEINRLEPSVRDMSDEDLARRACGLRQEAAAERALTDMEPLLFALVREASRRTLGLRPFDVQIVAALAMARRAVVEMQTGEGKTLAAVLPAALHALTGRGVHVLTVNDYLARRDAGWMGPVFRALGLSASCVQQGMAAPARRSAYAADVTYVTAREAGFDHLRDLLATSSAACVHRAFSAAIADEADSLIIDEARIPLVIAASDGMAQPPVGRLADVVSVLTPGLHYDGDEHGQNVELTEAGFDHVETALACGPLHDSGNYELLVLLNCALHAHVLLRRDVHYLVRGGRIEMIDEMTGRVVNDRRWPDGLQAALEAKEGLRGREGSRTLASMTVRRFLSNYPHLCGMTGTAQDCARELWQLYGVEVVVVPPNRPFLRRDHPDAVFDTCEAKERAVAEEVRRAHATGRPVLVGTLTIPESERLADRLAAAGVRCRVLNARHDEQEAAIVADAGSAGAVTIATNMAGRGTDIRLGGAAEQDRERVLQLGGLYVIGTNRHESSRVDLQLRGRAGRQGDPGESRFFVSLEDDMLARYGLQQAIAGRVAATPIDNPVIRHEIARTQRIVDGHNAEIRRALLRYSDVVEQQHALLVKRRQDLLTGTTASGLWRQAPEQFDALARLVGEEALLQAEREVTVDAIDLAWSNHLTRCAELREGSVLAQLGGQEPLHRFTREAVDAFEMLDDDIDDAVRAALARVRVTAGTIDRASLGIHTPTATWTHVVHDDPFRNQIGVLLSATGGVTVAIYSAAVLMPLLMLWGLADKLLRRRPGRRSPAGDGGTARHEDS